ncbi:MAG: DUF1064 domain-containing protein [Paracoccaceae bacterium]|nr:DUF1064 domain-containing protein [Paracoccaceae bacterium]
MKGNKYGAKATVVDGVRFASMKEAKRWVQLSLMEKAGEIRNLRRQVAIPMIGQIAPMKTRSGKQMRMTVDFAYEDRRRGWTTVYEDSKGKPTRDYEVRRAAVMAMGFEVLET